MRRLPVADEARDAPEARPTSRRVIRLRSILWAAFLVACALEFLVFAVVDPATIDALGAARGFRTAVYSVTFFVLWIVIAVAGFATTSSDE